MDNAGQAKELGVDLQVFPAQGCKIGFKPDSLVLQIKIDHSAPFCKTGHVRDGQSAGALEDPEYVWNPSFF